MICGVSYSSELRRIEALPRRRWEEYNLSAIRRLINDELQIGSMNLWDTQVAALHDVVVYKGGMLPIGVGQGKALISILAPLLMAAIRPVLFIPAQARDQTNLFVLPMLKNHWRLHSNLKIIGYSELSLMKNAHMLDENNPDLIILDECHYVKDTSSGRTRRLVRWFREHPTTMCVAMSGTICSHSIKDFAHIIQWCLKNTSPLPLTWHELQDWADAIDEDVPDEARLEPGALALFCAEGENVRQGFQRRLTETPGVVSSHSQLGCDASIQISKFPPQIPPELKKVVEKVRSTWETPSKDIITEASVLWRILRELALGWYYHFDPIPPRDWLDARRAWKRYVRETLQHNRRGLDTELQVWNECDRQPNIIWFTWRDIKNTFKPNSVPVWISEFALEAVTKWAWVCQNECQKGIIWVESIPFGERLGKYAHLPYFGEGKTDILSTDAPVIIASIQANSEIKNLERFSRNLLTSPPSSGKIWEQLMGRTHRPGQKADVVTFEVMAHEPELLESFKQACRQARALEDTLGMRQKLNWCDIDPSLR